MFIKCWLTSSCSDENFYARLYSGDVDKFGMTNCRSIDLMCYVYEFRIDTNNISQTDWTPSAKKICYGGLKTPSQNSDKWKAVANDTQRATSCQTQSRICHFTIVTGSRRSCQPNSMFISTRHDMNNCPSWLVETESRDVKHKRMYHGTPDAYAYG